jgi:hypothetical protein
MDGVALYITATQSVWESNAGFMLADVLVHYYSAVLNGDILEVHYIWGSRTWNQFISHLSYSISSITVSG